MIHTECIAITVVDWKNYLASAQKFLGHSLSGTIDKFRMKQDLASFIVTLADLQREQVDPQKLLKEAGYLLRHASASFLCVTPHETLNLFREETDLAITSITVSAVFKMAVVSGNLQQWQQTIASCSSDRLTTEIRVLCNKFMASFELSGLHLWGGYSKTPMKDQTLRLTQK